MLRQIMKRHTVIWGFSVKPTERPNEYVKVVVISFNIFLGKNMEYEGFEIVDEPIILTENQLDALKRWVRRARKEVAMRNFVRLNMRGKSRFLGSDKRYENLLKERFEQVYGTAQFELQCDMKNRRFCRSRFATSY